jgi:hypothetical protein
MIIVNSMLEAYSYLVTLTVSSPDGRTDSISTTLTSGPVGSPVLSVSTSQTKINFNSKLELDGLIKAYNAQFATWSVDDPSMSISEIAFTQTSKVFGERDTRVGVMFPMSIKPFNLLPQKTYIFTLASSPVSNSSLIAYGTISVTINSPPSPGIFEVSPPEGIALITKFSATLSFWTDDLSDYPITYQFQYSQGPDSDYVMLLSYSEKTSAIFQLPAGLLSQEFNVSFKGSISDNYGAVNNVFSSIKGFFFNNSNRCILSNN